KNSLFPVLFSLRVLGMDTTTCRIDNQNASQFNAQRKFYQWVLKWINGEHAHTDWNNEEMRDIRHSTKPDVPTLASFLQGIGFKLLSFEKHNDPLLSRTNENNIEAPQQQGVLKIAVECDISNMRAVLELGGITCQCPNPDHIKDASFWSISGTGPIGSTDNIVQKVEETGSNLLPRLSKDVIRVLRDVSYKLFDTIVNEPDVNRNTDVNLNVSHTSNASCGSKTMLSTLPKEIGVIRSYTQPEMYLHTDDVNLRCIPEKQSKDSSSDTPINRATSPIQLNKPVLQRQKTWDIDIGTGSLDEEPRPSPPKLTSSPAIVAELSNSLGQISLQSEIENPKNITEYILGAQQNLEKALKVLLVKKPKIWNDLSPHLDTDSASVKSAPANISPAAIISPYKPTRSSTKPLSKLNYLTHEQQTQMKTFSGNLTQTPRARRNIEPTLSKSVTRRNVKLEQENSNHAVRRSSFYIPSSAKSNTSLLKPSDIGQKYLGTRRYSTSK
ncbi:hypothetical protein WN48_10521, partial [Eufriesea mexicana]